MCTYSTKQVPHQVSGEKKIFISCKLTVTVMLFNVIQLFYVTEGGLFLHTLHFVH